jgi:hypothetical protein
MTEQRIKHMVIFSLQYEVDSAQTDHFLKKSKEILETISYVENFEVFRQVSTKNDFPFGFSMEFIDNEAYTAYNAHPVHVDYVNNIWNQEVDRFLEIDFVPHS